jgi:hypothetical protein
MNKIKIWIKRVWTKVKLWAYIMLVSIGLIALPIEAAEKSFSWTNASQREDGSAFDAATEQAEVRLYCDGDTVPTFVSVGAATTYTGSFSFGSHTCYATTLDTDDQESLASNSVTFVLTPARPNPPVLSVN